ncbi:MAG: nucleotidyltransferase family protein [Magnetococcales bacterium]|nr:nucleotidyltransferase family protein [Magnetococcales bacterium]
MNLEKLREERHRIIQIARQYGACNIRLFGSIVQGKADGESDVDFLVEMAPDRSLLERIALKQALEDLLSCQVDLVSDKSLHWYVRDKILNEAVPL